MNQQDSVLYTGTCLENVGDLDDDENIHNRKYNKKCSSYEINVNPEGQRYRSLSRCCSPKVSGPFMLETFRKRLVLESDEPDGSDIVEKNI